MRRSLRTWLSLGLATLVALAVLSVTVVVLGVLVPSLNAKVEAQSRTLSQAAATQINSFLESFSSQMSGLCDEIAALPALDPAELRTIVDTIAHAEKGIDSLYVIDEDDRVLEVGLPMKHRPQRNDQLGIDFSGRSFALKARETGHEIWSNAYLSMRGNIVVAQAFPLTLPAKRAGESPTRGVLVGELNLNEVSRFARLLSSRDEVLTIILDSRGNVVGHPDPTRALHQENLKQLAPLIDTAGERKTAHFNVDSISYLGSATPIPATGWTALVGQPTDRAFSIVRSTLLSLAIGCALALAMAVLTALIASRRLMTQVRQFATHLEAVAGGNYHAQIPRSTIDEVETLSQHMRSMAEAVLEREAHLQRAAKVFSHAREGIIITDASGTITEVNDAFTRITGFTREEAIGKTPRMLKSNRQNDAFYAEMWRALTQNGHWQGEIWNRKKSGELFAALSNITAVTDAMGATQNYVDLFTDITQMKAYQRQLEHIAHFDALTELPNRVLLADRIRHAMTQSLRRNLSLAVIYLDLDGFKSVNDLHGHDVGDKLLLAISRAMKGVLRDGDTIARIGGDEFVAVLVDLASERDCFAVLERLLTAASNPFEIDGHTLQLSASIGVTFYPEDGADADLLMRHADRAMYHAKQSGRNRYAIFDIAGDAAAVSQSRIVEDIREALTRNEFVLHYQPKVNMANGTVIGAEALIRWQHPERGLVPPGEFLRCIENHPIGITLGEWVIDTAIAQIDAWRDAGLDIPISVNVGARQLLQDDFIGHLTAALAKRPKVHPERLELEILETSALDDLARTSQLVLACRELGIRFALDDFGTGYSSLTYLRGLPAAALKIDQSFVRSMLDDPNDHAIVVGIISLATAFQREVIAEGVETAELGAELLALGCELAQGYGIARPMPAAEFPAWVSSWKPPSAWASPVQGESVRIADQS